MDTIEVRTQRRETLVDITNEVSASIEESGVREGLCHLWSFHTTAALTVNESADPAVAMDMTGWLSGAVPRDAGYRHLEGNSDAHVKTSLFSPGLSLIVSAGRPVLGRWQGVFLCEFDGPRTRRIAVQMIAAGP
jgi:secondary thiamine-phosphate synthase enzyme